MEWTIQDLSASKKKTQVKQVKQISFYKTNQRILISEQLTRRGYRIDYQMYLINESDLRMTP